MKKTLPYAVLKRLEKTERLQHLPVERMPGENFINMYEEIRKALEEVDANRNETDLDEETQKALDDMVSNGPSCRPDVVKEPETPKEVE